jgi:hypothetical protein
MKAPLPTELELSRLPRGAVLALVTQCLRKLEPMVRAISADGVSPTFHQAIDFVERFANGHVPSDSDCVEVSQKLTNLWNSADLYTLSNDPELHLRYSLEGAEFAVCIPFDILNHRDDQVAGGAALSIERSLKGLALTSKVPLYKVGMDFERLPEAREIRNDFDLLVRYHRELEGSPTLIKPAQFFDLHWQTDPNFGAGGILVSDVVATTALSLLERASVRPESLFAMTPRQFEVLIAELLRSFGYEVELTSATRDGGCDIIAVSRRAFNLRFLIECKRYARNRKVDVGIVRALHGVVDHDQGTKGVIVTTSGFTQPALAHLDQHRWLLEGRDFDGLMEWLAVFRNSRFEMNCEAFVAAQAVLRANARR